MSVTADMLHVIAPGLRVVGGTPADLVWAETLAYQPAGAGYLFALVRLAGGRHAAVWQAHAVIGTLDELTAGGEDAVLNRHELGLIPRW